MKYFLVDEADGKPITDKEQTRCIGIRHEDGTCLIEGLGNDRLTPFTEDRAKLDEMIELANEAAAYRKLKADYWKGVGLRLKTSLFISF